VTTSSDSTTCCLKYVLAERAGFEPAVGGKPTHAFQACSFSLSDTSPNFADLYKILQNHSFPDQRDLSSTCAADSGEAGIRTLGTQKGTTVFETAPFSHSGTSPNNSQASVVDRYVGFRLMVRKKALINALHSSSKIPLTSSARISRRSCCASCIALPHAPYRGSEAP
jgi:hypothetical protein